MKKLLFFLSLAIVSCSKDNLQEACIETVLEEIDMIRYSGQDLDNRFYLTMSEYDEGYYFTIGHEHIEVIPVPFDCNKVLLCSAENFANECVPILKRGREIGIVGVARR